MKSPTLPFWRWAVVATLCIGTMFGQAATRPCAQCAEWNKPEKPFRIFGNTYYVGPHGLTSLLITSKSGHILIDGGLPSSARQIAANIQALGFRVKDVKLIVNSHVHFDHAGGIAELQRLSGALVVASPWSASVLRRGDVGRSDPQHGALRPTPAVKKVQDLQDGQSFRIGGEIVITAHLTPGHTPGGTSWTWQSCEHNVCRNLVYADSLTPVSARGFLFTHNRTYPSALEDFDRSFRFLETVPCDILITPHPEFSRLFDRLAERERGSTVDPMVDRQACQQLAEQGRAALRERIAEEGKRPAGKGK